jgi:hypothetical protein
MDYEDQDLKLVPKWWSTFMVDSGYGGLRICWAADVASFMLDKKAAHPFPMRTKDIARNCVGSQSLHQDF